MPISKARQKKRSRANWRRAASPAPTKKAWPTWWRTAAIAMSILMHPCQEARGRGSRFWLSWLRRPVPEPLSSCRISSFRESASCSSQPRAGLFPPREAKRRQTLRRSHPRPSCSNPPLSCRLRPLKRGKRSSVPHDANVPRPRRPDQMMALPPRCFNLTDRSVKSSSRSAPRVDANEKGGATAPPFSSREIFPPTSGRPGNPACPAPRPCCAGCRSPW